VGFDPDPLARLSNSKDINVMGSQDSQKSGRRLRLSLESAADFQERTGGSPA